MLSLEAQEVPLQPEEAENDASMGTPDRGREILEKYDLWGTLLGFAEHPGEHAEMLPVLRGAVQLLTCWGFTICETKFVLLEAGWDVKTNNRGRREAATRRALKPVVWNMDDELFPLKGQREELRRRFAPPYMKLNRRRRQASAVMASLRGEGYPTWLIDIIYEEAVGNTGEKEG